jgi:hypothetical protein
MHKMPHRPEAFSHKNFKADIWRHRTTTTGGKQRRRAVDPDAHPAVSSEEQQLLQLQINATAHDQVQLQMETELSEVDARRATLTSQQVVSGLLPPPAHHANAALPDEAPQASPPSEVAALVQLFQLQMQQPADREQCYEDAWRIDVRLQSCNLRLLNERHA